RPRRQAAALDETADVAEGAMLVVMPVVVLLDADIEFGRGDAVHRAGLGTELVTAQVDAGELGAQMLERQAEREQRAHRHVSANAGETVEAEDGHGPVQPCSEQQYKGMRELVCPPGFSDRLDRALPRLIADMSRTQARKLIAAGSVFV